MKKANKVLNIFSVLIFLITMLLVLGLTIPHNVQADVTDVIINEVDADQVGTDNAEFIELYDGGVGNTDLTGLVLALYNGNGDVSYVGHTHSRMEGLPMLPAVLAGKCAFRGAADIEA